MQAENFLLGKNIAEKTKGIVLQTFVVFALSSATTSL
jgi:hypothetical protein